MKSTIVFCLLLAGASCLMTSCQAPAASEPAAAINVDSVKAMIQALEVDYANASNAKDVAGVLKYYAADAEIYSAEDGTQVGLDAIKAILEKDMAADTSGHTVSFTVTGVWASGNMAVETGTSTTSAKDGSVVHTGKYMVLYELRDGKYIAIREMNMRDKAEAPKEEAKPAQ